MRGGRAATILGVAVVAAVGSQLLTDEGVENAPLVVLGAGLFAAGLAALLIRV